jgi:hypothetical protein
MKSEKFNTNPEILTKTKRVFQTSDLKPLNSGGLR